MPNCDYCSSSFADEDEYIRHLKAEHADELGPIDRRRVSEGSESDGLPIGAIALGTILLAAIALVGYIVFITVSDSTADQATYDPDVHDHGTIEVIIDGEELDFSDNSTYIENDQVFHFHGDETEQYGTHVWHVHGRDVTLQYALETVGIEVNDDGTALTHDGQTYDANDPGTEIRITVNGESAEPGSYVLDGVEPMDAAAAGEGDDVRIVVETDGY